MTKERTSVTVDEELKKRIDKDESLNVSGLFNQFLREYYSTGSVSGVDVRLELVEQELQDARDKVERLEAERDQLVNAKEVRQERERDKLEDCLNRLDGIAYDNLTADNPAVTTQAEKVGMSPSEFAKKARQHRESD